jgi:hypothetical protein
MIASMVRRSSIGERLDAQRVGRAVVRAIGDARCIRRMGIAAGRPLCEKAALPRGLVVVDCDGVEVQPVACDAEAPLWAFERRASRCA